MKKATLFLLLISLNTLTTAQTPIIEKLKKELKNHTKQDTIRVNRLNDLSGNQYLPKDEKRKFADEALAISKKINYKRGKGYALSILAGVEFSDGNIEKGRSLIQQADSLTLKTEDIILRVMILRRKSFFETDKKKKEILLMEADTLAKISENLYWQAIILVTRADINSNLQENIDLRQRADSLIQLAGDLEFQAYNLGYLAYFISTIDQAEYLFSKADSLAKETGNLLLLSDIEGWTGSYYLSNKSDFAKGMEYYLKSLRTAESSKDTLRLIQSWINLGTLYSYMGDQVHALEYFEKAEEANKRQHNLYLEYSLQTSIGERYRLMDKYPEAIKAYNKAIELAKRNNYFGYVVNSNLADVYTRMDSLSLAFYYAFLSLKRAQELGDISINGWIDGILSRAYFKKNMMDSAVYYGILGLKASIESGTIEFMRDNSLALANAYAAKKDFKNAYENHLLYVNYRDSMMNAEVRNRTSVQQYTFNLDKKEAEISVLHEQKKGQRNLLIGAMVLLSLILAIASLLLRNNRQKQKANRLLEKQKQEIDEKAQELARQKNNVELLSNIGQKITASLSVEKIIGTVYDNINKLMDANVFGIGIYNDELKRLEFPSTYENGEPLPFYSNDIADKNRFGSVCFTRGEEIAIGDLDKDYGDYIQKVPTPHEGGNPVSIIFLPLITKGKKLGVITVQSFQKNAYSDYQLFMFRNIATYAAIAIENAESYETLHKTFSTLKATQNQLIQSEKMASLGELTAGIAHEIQNPLNFVNNFSDVNMELIEEMKEELTKNNFAQAQEIAADIKQNLEKISHHGKRADSIVKGMLQHSRTNTGTKELIDINALADEYLRLSYHGLRAKDKSFNASFKTDFDETLNKIKIIPQDIGRVFLNVLNNAFFAVKEKKLQSKNGYEPTVLMRTKNAGNFVEITVKDNGNGIPREALEKIFQPFFTTKPTGQGTGLGLSLSYDIIRAHGGQLDVTTKENEYSEFKIVLPFT